ncbi:MAG TPA: hypothetical protein VGK73_14155 [Polyangiaceae bacterium]
MSLEDVRHPKAICSPKLVESSYQECEDGLVGFYWRVDQPYGADVHRLQFDANTSKLVYGYHVLYDSEGQSLDRSVSRAGSPRSGTDCRSCRICSPDEVGNGGAGGVPNLGPGEDCVFDENGRIGLPPIEG